MINTENINNIYANNYVYKGSLLYKEEWENYRKTLFRFKLKNNDKQKNKNEQKYSKDELNKNKIIINSNHNINTSNFIDNILSFYIDINNYYTILISEFYYDINENDFSRFFDIANIFYEKLNNFIDKNFNIYLCNESILIEKSMSQLFNYIRTLNLFNNKKFIVKDIKSSKNEINIYIDINDKTSPAYRLKWHILKISDISSFLSILLMIDTKRIDANKNFNYFKNAIIFSLKKVKNNIEKENI